MGIEHSTGRVQAGSLAELDALVGRYVTGELPQTHWEDSHAQLRFDSIEEALEALREPYFQQFIPAEDRANTVLREVQEFSHYSADLALAWEVVAKLGNVRAPLRLWREGDAWQAAFGEAATTSADTAPVAICLAGLRARGLEVEFALARHEDAAVNGTLQGSLLAALRAGTLAD